MYVVHRHEQNEIGPDIHEVFLYKSYEDAKLCMERLIKEIKDSGWYYDLIQEPYAEERGKCEANDFPYWFVATQSSRREAIDVSITEEPVM